MSRRRDGLAVLRDAIAECDEATRPILSAAVQAFETLLAQVRGASELAPILAAVKTAALETHGVEMLVELASRHPLAEVALRDAASAKAARTRLAVLRGLDRRLPPALLVDLLRAGLADKSAKARAAVLARAVDLDAKALAPDLEAYAASLADPETQREAREEIALLRDGHVVERKASGRTWLTVKTPSGRTAQSVDEASVTPDRLPATVAAILAEWERSPSGAAWREAQAEQAGD